MLTFSGPSPPVHFRTGGLQCRYGLRFHVAFFLTLKNRSMAEVNLELQKYGEVLIKKYADYIRAEIELRSQGDHIIQDSVVKMALAKRAWDDAYQNFYGHAMKI